MGLRIAVVATAAWLLFLSGCAPAEGESADDAGRESVAEPTEVPQEQSREEIQYPTASYVEMLALFDSLGYTPEAWQAGIREVPRIYLTGMPERWRSQTVSEITVDLKKRLFFRGLAPLVLRSNELILRDRERLSRGREALASGEVSAEESAWLRRLAERYGVGGEGGAEPSGAVLDTLWRRVDVIPPSLALAQGAEESGWGTSRFAAQGNALFGQWTWGEHAMRPENQREGLGDYGVAAFETPLESVLSYMHNLNIHPAYSDLRRIRAQARADGREPTGYEMAAGLSRYSERGEEYVESLRTIMRVNQLAPADDAFLGSGPSIFLVAPDEVEPGSP
jgi:uncharacterized FlgJ-related protein